MAEEELKEEQQEKKSGGFAGNLKLIIAGIVIIILAAGVSFAVARMAALSTPQPTGKALDGDAKFKSETIGSTFDAGEYITNLSGGSRFIKVRVVLAFTNKDVELEVSNKVPVIQHTINKILREQTAESLSDPKSMEKLSEKLEKNINELLIKGNIDDVYFTYFVVQ